MKYIISLFAVIIFSQISQAAIIQLDKTNINDQVASRLQPFLNEIESKLPIQMREKLSTNKITLQFAQLDNENKVVLPNCGNTVDSLSEAQGVKVQFNAAKGKKEGVRFNQQIQSYVNRNTIVVNSNFLNVILMGESKAQGYMCDHRNTYRLAQAAVINGLARIYNGSKQKVSDSLNYRFVAGWNEKKLVQGFWPRALNPYEYAGEPADHFAYNMEFFILDPEYACRRPLLQNYLTRVVQSDPFNGIRNCTVNTEIKIPYEYAQPTKDVATGEAYDVSKTDLKTYDLDPSRVYNIYYMRASMGGGIGGFGHSMYRVVVCPPNMSLSKECEKSLDSDLVFNPRANPNEMRLDNMRGLFGGYPSQFLVNSVYELEAEYGDNELRHLFNMPLGQKDAQGRFQEVMSEDQKNRFIWAAIESYWTYYGNYKFISNNCSDEVMRLYQMTSDDPQVLKLGVLKPNDINKKLSKLGYIDDSEVRQFEKTPGILAKLVGFGKIKNQKEYDQRRAAIEQARYENAFVSKVYDIEDAVRAIMRLEGNPNPDFKVAKKEIQRWLAMATPDYKWEGDEKPMGIDSITEQQKKEIFSNTLYQIKGRYDRLMSNAKNQKEKDLVVFYFYRVMFHIYNKRAEQVGNQAIQVAYAVAYPSKDRSVKEMPKNVPITKEQFEIIRSSVDRYSEIQAQLMPFREATVKPGYGIPLKSEVVKGEQYLALKGQESESVTGVIKSLVGLLGPEHLLLQELGNFYNDLLAKRLASAEAATN